MKTILALTAITFFIVAAPVMAQSHNDNDRGNSITAETHFKVNDADNDNKVTPTSILQNVTPTCDPSGNWKNHGAFVSCVAHYERDDNNDNDMPDAAHFAIGKRLHFKNTLTPTPTISATPTEIITPTETPTLSPSVSPVPTDTPTASASSTPGITDMDIYKAPKNTVENNVETVISRFLSFLSHLL